MGAAANKYTFSAKIACDIVHYAGSKGADTAELFQCLGLEERYRNRDDIRIPADAMANVWALALKRSNDPFLAFHMGIEFAYSARNETLLIMQSSPTVQEAFELGMKYSEIVANVLSMELGQDGESFYMDYTPVDVWRNAPAEVVRDCLAVSLATNMISLQMCLGKYVAPTILTFEFPRPGNVNEFLGIFNASIEFDQPQNRIGFPKDVSQLPISTSDNGLLGSLKRYGDELKSRIWPQNEIVQEVRNLIVDTLTSQSTPSIENAAKSMNISTRTLHRKLRAAETSYQRELDEVRKDLANRYLGENGKSLFEVGYLLGYANTTSFVRAYKRWHGTTPKKRKPIR